ncbi:MAG TPA: hypothetical protein DEG69_13695 [Flavobacteriaceae bacterium]|nr:hypothetical protein [Flavobacteriaceae bacterium]
MCPKLEVTLKSFPKNFSMVLAFAGDSTITKFFAIFNFVWVTKVCDFFYSIVQVVKFRLPLTRYKPKFQEITGINFNAICQMKKNYTYRNYLVLRFILIAMVSFLFQGCQSLADVPTFSNNNTINVVVEIPAGTNTKVEYNKELKKLKVDQQDGKDRIIEYLPYPGNYGFIPSTYSSSETGGDGDPLDALVISSKLLSGSVVETTPIGVLKLMDNGEKDYKVICIPSEKKLQTVSANTFIEFSEKYPDALKIIELWFSNYDTTDTVTIEGWGDEKEALAEIKKAVQQ